MSTEGMDSVLTSVLQSFSKDRTAWLLTNSNADKLTDVDREIASINNWMLIHRVHEKRELRCFNPGAFCWQTGQWLFLRPAIRFHCRLSGPDDDHNEMIYFNPGAYTYWCLATGTEISG
jgi:hypothetical protein